MLKIKSYLSPISLVYAIATSRDSEPENWVYDVEREEADRLSSIRIRDLTEGFDGSDSLPKLEIELPAESKEDERYVGLVEITLRLFPTGRVSCTELKKRIAQVNAAGKPLGFRLEGYDEIPKDRLWKYVTKDAPKQVSDFARTYCPNALERIASQNRQRLRERRDIR